MEVFSHLAMGFGVAITLQNVLYCFVGVLLGTLVGVLPGIGPVPTIANPQRLHAPLTSSWSGAASETLSTAIPA